MFFALGCSTALTCVLQYMTEVGWHLGHSFEQLPVHHPALATLRAKSQSSFCVHVAGLHSSQWVEHSCKREKGKSASLGTVLIAITMHEVKIIWEKTVI